MSLRFIFLSDEFYKDYPAEKCPEIERSKNRLIMYLYIEIDCISYAIPLRSNIRHQNVVWTDETNNCGLDLSKAVVISSENYIDSTKTPKLDREEFRKLVHVRDTVVKLMRKYVKNYMKARRSSRGRSERVYVRYSALQYFEKELGIFGESTCTENTQKSDINEQQ